MISFHWVPSSLEGRRICALNLLRLLDPPWPTIALVCAMVAAITLACAMVAVTTPIASMKAHWSKPGGSGLLFRPPPQHRFPLLAIYIHHIVIESYSVFQSWGSSLNFEISPIIQLVVHVSTINRPQYPELSSSFFFSNP